MLVVLYFLYIITFVYAFIIRVNSMLIIAAILPFLVPVIFKVLKLKMSEEIKIINIIFIYFSGLIGSCLGGYSLSYYDKIIHFFSGIIGCEIAYIIYKCFHNKENIFMIIFINSMNMMIAFLWEFYEYILLFFNYDAIRHYTTGVHDTLSDMIVCFFGGLLLSLIIIKIKNNFFVRLQKQLFLLNEIDIKKEL